MIKKHLLSRQDTLDYLAHLALPFKLYEHEAVANMKEMAEKVKLEHAPLVKNLVYSDSKAKGFYYVLVLDDGKVEKAAWKKAGVNPNNIRLAKEQDLETLHTFVGAVNPFCLKNDEHGAVKRVLIDESLFAKSHWAFHPMDNTASVEMEQADFLKFLETEKIHYERLDLAAEEEKVEKVEKGEKGEKKEEENTGKETTLGIDAKKGENFSKWYQEVIIKSGLIEYYDISGCYILRPWAYSIWDKIQRFFDGLIQGNGVENAYFPMFVSKKALSTEEDHIEGFEPEVAWVTKYGTSELAEPIAIRPTSETIMYPSYAKWIQSHRDLPLKLNQWTNVVRWEFKNPTPFIRTREFLWQEGHTAYATRKEAEEETLIYLDFYRRVYEELLAVPVCKGVKTESEKFAGGDFTTTVETWISENGRAIQAATSHHLGQNFAKMFGIEFLDDKKEKQFAWQTSWGLTTRSIGIMVMYHGDDKGLVLPPRVAKTQVVIVPIYTKNDEKAILQKAGELFERLKKDGVRVHLDDRDNHKPGWKYNDWELKGVPIRLELGAKDLEKGEVRAVTRWNGHKEQLKWEGLSENLLKTLDQIQDALFANAKAKMNAKRKQAVDWKDFMVKLNDRNVVETPWCGVRTCEEKVKERSGIETKELASEGEANLTGQAKTLCVPYESQELTNEICFHCGEKATKRVLWGRSY